MVVNITEKNRSPFVSNQVKGQDDSNATAANPKAIHNHLLAVLSQGVKELNSSQGIDFEELIEKDMITILAMVAMLQVLSQEGRALFNLPSKSTDNNNATPAKDVDDSTSPTTTDTDASSTGFDIDTFLANFLTNIQSTDGSTDSLLERIETMIAELNGGAKAKPTLSDLHNKGVDLTCSLLKDLCGGLDPQFIASITKMLVSLGITQEKFKSLINIDNLPPNLAFILQTVSIALGVAEAIDRMPNPTEEKISKMVAYVCMAVNEAAKGFEGCDMDKPITFDLNLEIDFSESATTITLQARKVYDRWEQDSITRREY